MTPAAIPARVDGSRVTMLAAMSRSRPALKALALISKPSSSAGYSPSRDRTRSPRAFDASSCSARRRPNSATAMTST